MAMNTCTIRVSSQCGFTLIESVVAMGLFAGVVFMLVSVFNDFMLDNYPARSYQAVALAQKVISEAELHHNLSVVKMDTLGFHITRKVVFSKKLAEEEVTVTSARLPFINYATLSDSWPIR